MIDAREAKGETRRATATLTLVPPESNRHDPTEPPHDVTTRKRRAVLGLGDALEIATDLPTAPARYALDRAGACNATSRARRARSAPAQRARRRARH